MCGNQVPPVRAFAAPWLGRESQPRPRRGSWAPSRVLCLRAWAAEAGKNGGFGPPKVKLKVALRSCEVKPVR